MESDQKFEIEENDGFSFTFPYPRNLDTMEGDMNYYTCKLAKAIDLNTQEVTSHLLVMMVTKNDPRTKEFRSEPEDETMMIPMTESSTHGFMNVLMSLRIEMNPETSSMLQTMFQSGNFKKN